MDGQIDRDSAAIIAEYQERKRLFQRLWNRNMLLLATPGFILFALGNPLVLDSNRLVIAGLVLFGPAVACGAYFVFRYRRCPACDRVQTPEWRFPYRSCLGCGARLSVVWKDST